MIGQDNIVISAASLKDLNALRKLEEVSFPIDRWPLLDLFGVLTFPGIVRLKAEANGEFAGFVAGDVRKSGVEGWITTIAVDPRFRKMGIGQKLLAECEKLMRVRYIKLSVRKSNTDALNLYFRNGYTQKEIWNQYYIDGEDGIVLEKVVDFN